MKVATVADIHNGPNAKGPYSGHKLTDQAMPLLNEFLEKAEERKDIDLIANLGDFIEHDGTDMAEDLKNFNAVLGSFNRSSLKSIHTIGNHDLLNLSQVAVAGFLQQDKLYHSFDIEDHHIVTLHTYSPNRDGSDVSVSPEQLKWLHKDLSNTDKPTLVISHHPLSDQDLRGNTWFEDYRDCALVQNRDEVRTVLQKFDNVVGVINGHTHWNNLEVHDGIPYVTQQSLVEKISDGVPAAAHGLITMDYGQFGMELFGNNPLLSHSDVANRMATAYDAISDSYRKETAQYGEDERHEFNTIATLLPEGGDKTIVDFGCGPARDAYYFEAAGFQYIGVDVCAGFISHARKTVPNGEFYQADFTTVQLPKNSADIAWHSSSLQHVKKEALIDTLQNAFDTLKPGGFFYSHYRSGEGESIQISTEYGAPIARFIALYTEKEMNEALKEVGFDIVSSRTFDHQYSGLKGETVKYKTKVIAQKPNKA